MTLDITIVGGGLAGLTLGIALRQRDVRVTIWEAGKYPRHRVCGEFISGGGTGVLDRLGLRELLEDAGAFEARTVQFIAGGSRSPVRTLPVAALCLSRHSLDALLADKFRQLGGELRENTRWQSTDVDAIVHASGRRARPVEHGWRWFGLKAHAHQLPLAADLEMHVSPAGYVGLNRIDHNTVNVCGLFRTRPGTAEHSGFELLRGKPGSPLFERTADARFDPASFCSVAGLSLSPHRAVDDSRCCIGDALTMIPPITGNGMSMALESAAIAAEPVAAFSQRKLSWSEARLAIARACDAAFARRLAWARFAQWLLFSPLLENRAAGVLLRSDWLWNLLFARTR